MDSVLGTVQNGAEGINWKEFKQRIPLGKLPLGKLLNWAGEHNDGKRESVRMMLQLLACAPG